MAVNETDRARYAGIQPETPKVSREVERDDENPTIYNRHTFDWVGAEQKQPETAQNQPEKKWSRDEHFLPTTFRELFRSLQNFSLILLLTGVAQEEGMIDKDVTPQDLEQLIEKTQGSTDARQKAQLTFLRLMYQSKI